MLRRHLLVTIVVLFVLAPLPGHAEGQFPKPEGRVILTVSGEIEATNMGGSAQFDRTMLELLGWRTIETYTDWTEGQQQFGGVTLKAVLDRVGAQGDTISAHALNDYSVSIPVSDAEEFEVLLALDNFGEPMSVREKGPIWIIYPSSAPGDGAPKPNNEKMVWQLHKLIVD